MHLDKDKLHHAYLLLGEPSILLPQILDFIENLGVSTKNNPDFLKLEFDVFKIEDARTLKSMASEKTFATGESKKVFIISANQFLIEAQNTLLKVFEEPASNFHFFVVSKNSQSFLPTLLSRFYVIETNEKSDKADAAEFLKMNLAERFEYIKEMLQTEEEDEVNSPRTIALEFLGNLEKTLYHKFPVSTLEQVKLFEHIFSVRENLRQPGSAPKTLIESVALAIPPKI